LLTPNCIVERLTLLLRIRDGLGSNSKPDSGYLDKIYIGLFRHSMNFHGQYSKLSHGFASHTFYCINHLKTKINLNYI
jgi:hypothetical protein